MRRLIALVAAWSRRRFRRSGPPTATELVHPRYGPIALLDDVEGAGPILLSLEGYRAWVRDGRPAFGPRA